MTSRALRLVGQVPAHLPLEKTGLAKVLDLLMLNQPLPESGSFPLVETLFVRDCSEALIANNVNSMNFPSLQHLWLASHPGTYARLFHWMRNPWTIHCVVPPGSNRFNGPGAWCKKLARQHPEKMRESSQAEMMEEIQKHEPIPLLFE